MATTAELTAENKKQSLICEESDESHVWEDNEWEDGDGGQYREQYCRNCYRTRNFKAATIK